MGILVVSAFEAGFQPLAAACLAAALRDAGGEVSAWDADVFGDDVPTERFDLALVGIGQFEGIDNALAACDALTGRARHIVAYGQYAVLNAAALLDSFDGVLPGEPELQAPALVEVAEGHRDLADVPSLICELDTSVTATPRAARSGRRLTWSPPARELFRSMVHYPAHHSPLGLMGNIEVSRGCHHKCTYCAVYGAYDGGVQPIAGDTVVTDALRLADEGVRHFCFIDAEFFNSRTAGPDAMRRIASAVPGATFEFTTRVDHILDYPDLLGELVGLGLRRVTSALEFPSDRLLRIFDKGITVADMRAAIAQAETIGFDLIPTFIPFTPWVSADELDQFEDFLIDTGLARFVDATTMQTRLLLFHGSPLLDSPWLEGVDLVDRGFWFDWTHPDPQVEQRWSARRADAEGAGRTRCCVKC